MNARRTKDAEPRMESLDEPLTVAGMGIQTSDRTIARDAAALGRHLAKLKESIRNRAEPWRFVAASRDYEQATRSFFYFTGYVVRDRQAPPAGLSLLTVRPGGYAVFTIRPVLGFLWGPAIGRMKRHVYRDWLSAGPYRAAHRGIDDFELHDERSTGKKPSIELWVAVERKE
jgi:predicted transcriptional regulator YdeE